MGRLTLEAKHGPFCTQHRVGFNVCGMHKHNFESHAQWAERINGGDYWMERIPRVVLSEPEVFWLPHVEGLTFG